jgi:hypothetical protein
LDRKQSLKRIGALALSDFEDRFDGASESAAAVAGNGAEQQALQARRERGVARLNGLSQLATAFNAERYAGKGDVIWRQGMKNG